MRTTPDVCAVCGRGYHRGGSRRLYCSTPCLQLRAAIGIVSRRLEEVLPRLDDQHRRSLRSDLWDLANRVKFPPVRKEVKNG